MKKEKGDFFSKHRRKISFITAVFGLLVWFVTPLEKEFYLYLIRTLGFLFLIFGLYMLNARDCPFTEKQKKVIFTILIVLITLVLAGFYVFINAYLKNV